MIQEEIKKLIQQSIKRLGIESDNFVVEHPSIIVHGDFATNVALSVAKEAGANPRELAEKIADIIRS